MTFIPFQMDGQYVPSNRIFCLAHYLNYAVNQIGLGKLQEVCGNKAPSEAFGILFNNVGPDLMKKTKEEIFASEICISNLSTAGNLAAAKSSALKYGLIDINFSFTEFSQIVLSPFYSEQEVFFIYLSKLWMMDKDRAKYKHLLSALYELYQNNHSRCITEIKNATQNNLDILNSLFELFTGSKFNPLEDKISPNSGDNIKHILDKSGLLLKDELDFSPKALEILKFFSENQHRLRTPDGDDYLGRYNTGLYELIDKDSYQLFAKICPTMTSEKLFGKNVIFYGAPGTGKSHQVNKVSEQYETIRTTFHPDSDYSTFVGCYKPKMEEVVLRDLSGHKVVENGLELKEKRIVYKFTEQAFLQAYIKAWRETTKPIFLIIEEINRGNCAQIFGDLFQLLDRNDDGYSTYPIVPDTDLSDFIGNQGLNVHNAILKKDDGTTEDISGFINSGEKLVLPPNLYIWATMNTSDQSLFPIDSAFKRRWDWHYMPINTKKEKWVIRVNNHDYSWTSFLDIINEIVHDKTQSEDKQLGFYFCKAKEGVIDADTFVGKVLFYLWNDVFKDYGFDDDIFVDEMLPDGTFKPLAFKSFYDVVKREVNQVKAEKFLLNLKVESSEDEKKKPEGEGGDGESADNKGSV